MLRNPNWATVLSKTISAGADQTLLVGSTKQRVEIPDASQIAPIIRLNRNTINRCHKGIRDRKAALREGESPLQGEVEVEEFFFGARRVYGKRGRGAHDKTIVL